MTIKQIGVKFIQSPPLFWNGYSSGSKMPCLANNLPSKIHIGNFSNLLYTHLMVSWPNKIPMDFLLIFPSFPMSYYVPFKFLLGFLSVPHILNVFPNMFSIAPHFIPICFGKFCSPFTYISTGRSEQTLYFKIELTIFGETPQFQFFFD